MVREAHHGVLASRCAARGLQASLVRDVEQGGFGLRAYRTKRTTCSPTWGHERRVQSVWVYLLVQPGMPILIRHVCMLPDVVILLKLDYSAGVLPVTHVDKVVDTLGLSTRFKPRNAIEKGSYKMYDSAAMHGLPVGVQVVGRRLEEEKVMEGMKIVQHLLKKDGFGYQLLETS